MSDPPPPGDGGLRGGLYGQVSISGQRLSLARRLLYRLAAPLAAGLMYRLITDGRALPLPVRGPLDGTDSAGQPWINAEAVSTVRQRLNQEAPTQARPPQSPRPVRAAPPGG